MKRTIIITAMQLSIALGFASTATAMELLTLAAGSNSRVEQAMENLPESAKVAYRKLEQRSQYYSQRIADEEKVVNSDWASEREKVAATQRIAEIGWQKANEFQIIMTGVEASIAAERPQDGAALANPAQQRDWQKWAELLLPLVRKNETVLGTIQGILGLVGVKANEWSQYAQQAPELLGKKADEDSKAIRKKYEQLMRVPMGMLAREPNNAVAQRELDRLRTNMKAELDEVMQRVQVAANASQTLQGALNWFQGSLQDVSQRLATGVSADKLLTVDQADLRIEYIKASYQGKIDAAAARGDTKTKVFLNMRMAKEIAAICVVVRDHNDGPVLRVLDVTDDVTDDENDGALVQADKDDDIF